jgi:hypothetical protein
MRVEITLREFHGHPNAAAFVRSTKLMPGFLSELINQRDRRPVQIVRWMIPAIPINENHHLFDSRSLGNVAWFG